MRNELSFYSGSFVCDGLFLFIHARSYVLLFNRLTLMLLGVDIFQFLLLRFYWISLMCRWIFFTNLGSFLLLFLQIFFFPSFFSPFPRHALCLCRYVWWYPTGLKVLFTLLVGVHSKVWIINANLMFGYF